MQQMLREGSMSLFDKSYENLSDLVCGRTIHVSGRRFTIMAAEGYSRRENEAPLYRPLTTMTPGQVYCPRQRRAILFLIACRDGMAYGGCILIRELRTPTGAVFTGPAAVSEALGIGMHKATGRMVELPEGDLRLELNAPPDSQGRHRPPHTDEKKRSSGIGPKTLERLMPAISEHWISKGGDQNFQAYLAALLARCKTEAQLRRALKD